MARELPTRAHLHYGICRHCFGTGEVHRDVGRKTCPACEGEGALP